MILAVDIGNSRVKVGRYENGHLRLPVLNYSHTEFLSDFRTAPEMENMWGKVKYIGVASVGKEDMKQALVSLAADLPQAVLVEIGSRTPLPVKNGYGTPETLGIDRVCSAVGALAEGGTCPLLVIDAGTAITYDYVDADRTYLGGGISPGIHTRFRALDEFTAALPLVRKEGRLPLVGDSTETSIRSGVVNGVVAEMDGIVARYKEMAGEALQVFLTGGDAQFLGNHVKNLNFVDPNLLLGGIHSIILYNEHA